MRCPFCHHDDSQVKDSRPSEDGSAIRRRRQCPQCGARFTTHERVQLRELVVTKRSGKREPFDREKLVRSATVACRKRDVEPERIERLVSAVVRQLESQGEPEVGADDIGRHMMAALERLDPVAYIRFASVYKDFREARDFEAFASEVAEAARPGEGQRALPLAEAKKPAARAARGRG